MGNKDEKNLAVNLPKDSEVRKSRALLFAQTTPSNLPIPAQRLFLALLSNIDNKTTKNTKINGYITLIIYLLFLTYLLIK